MKSNRSSEGGGQAIAILPEHQSSSRGAASSGVDWSVEMQKIGVMVCGHGSRDPEAIEEFKSVAAGIAQRLPQYPADYGFLEFAKPIIRDGLDRLRGRGVERIL